MGRPASRAELLTASAREYERLGQVLDGLDPPLAEDVGWQAPIEDRSRNPRDVVTHVHAWHLMVIEWCRVGDAGGTPEVPGGGHTWREIPAINDEIWERFREVPYDTSRRLLAASHLEVHRADRAAHRRPALHSRCLRLDQDLDPGLLLHLLHVQPLRLGVQDVARQPQDDTVTHVVGPRGGGPLIGGSACRASG